MIGFADDVEVFLDNRVGHAAPRELDIVGDAGRIRIGDTLFPELFTKDDRSPFGELLRRPFPGSVIGAESHDRRRRRVGAGDRDRRRNQGPIYAMAVPISRWRSRSISRRPRPPTHRPPGRPTSTSLSTIPGAVHDEPVVCERGFRMDSAQAGNEHAFRLSRLQRERGIGGEG